MPSPRKPSTRFKHISRKRRTRAHIDGDRAVHAIEGVVLDRGFALERTTIDYGTDFTLHVFDDDGGYIGFLSGQSRARRALQPNADGTFSLTIDMRHLAQWLAPMEPFIVVLYDTDRSTGYWYFVQAHRAALRRLPAVHGGSQKSVTLRFDPRKILDLESLDLFRQWVIMIQEQAARMLEYSEDA
jgi:Domain of unknown function (DUF4365)